MSAQRLRHSHNTPASSRLGQALEWLTAWRAEHPGEVRAADLIAAAGEAGINATTLHRARKQLGLRTRQAATGWIVGAEGLTSASSLSLRNAASRPALQTPVTVPTGSPDPPAAGTPPTQPASYPSLLGPLGAQRHRAPADSQSGCAHAAARIVAVLASPEGDELGPQGDGLVWWLLDNQTADDATALGNLDGQRATVYLGTCRDCAASVVTVHTWDPAAWSTGHASAWSSPWTPLHADGRQA